METGDKANDLSLAPNERLIHPLRHWLANQARLLVRRTKRVALQIRKFKETARCGKRFLANIHRKPGDYPHYLSAVAIVKNEVSYMAEWLEHHLLVGVTKFYIYDNESDDDLEEMLEPYIQEGIVEYKKWPGRRQQEAVYNHVLEKASAETFWLAVIDIDEFLNPLSCESAREFMTHYEDCPGLAINWQVFGSGGQMTRTPGLVTERFKFRALPEDRSSFHVKSIINPRKTVLNRPHSAIYLGWRQDVDTDRIPLERNHFYRVGKYDRFVINHYFGKSWEEYLAKRRRGDVAAYKPYDSEEFKVHDRNEARDDRMDRFVSRVKKNVRRRFGSEEASMAVSKPETLAS